MKKFLYIITLAVTYALIAEASNSQINVSAEVAHRQYREDLQAPEKSEETGTLYGIHCDYRCLNVKRLYLGVSAKILANNVSYDGSMTNYITGLTIPFTGKTHSHLIDAEAHIGYKICSKKIYSLIPYIGIGYHHWYRGKVKNVPGDYSERYYWPYAILGVRNIFKISQRLEIGIDLKAMKMFEAKLQTSLFPEKYTLGDKLHYSLELPIIYDLHIGDCMLTATPYYIDRRLGKSEVIMASSEPPSFAHTYGLRLGMS